MREKSSSSVASFCLISAKDPEVCHDLLQARNSMTKTDKSLAYAIVLQN